MPVRPLRHGDLPVLRTVYNAVSPRLHGFPATPEEFSAAFGGSPAHLSDAVTLVAEAGGVPVAFVRAGIFEPVPNRLTFASLGDGLVFGPFFPPDRLAEGAALLSAALRHLELCAADRVYAFDPVEAVGAPFHNGGWAGLSERLPHLVGLLARNDFRVRHRELLLTRPDMELPAEPPLPQPARLSMEERGGSRHTVRLKEGNTKIGDCHYSVMHPMRGHDDSARRYGYIDGLGIEEGYQGKGFGRLAIWHALRNLRDLGCGPVCLTTGADNLRAQNLYFSLGFALVDSTLTLARR